MDGFCRLCAETRPLEKMSDINNPELNIEQKLIDCCRWNHFKELNTNGNLPEHICIVCLEKLEQCWLFSELVASAQYKLIEILGNNQLTPCDENSQKLEDDTVNEYYYDGSVDILSETSAKVNVYVEIVENQQNLSDKDIEANPMEYHSSECMKLEKTAKKLNKNIRRHKNQSINESGKKMSQRDFNQNEGDPCTNVEKSFHSLNFVNNFPRLLKLEERNDDGTVNSDAIQRLGLVNWMVLQHQCWICYTCFCSNYE